MNPAEFLFICQVCIFHKCKCYFLCRLTIPKSKTDAGATTPRTIALDGAIPAESKPYPGPEHPIRDFFAQSSGLFPNSRNPEMCGDPRPYHIVFKA